jgi:catechol 2,3-dioxygenase-like lactoylglutathione lyase family enzyme
MVQITGLDHVVWIVADAERSIAWYRDKLGLEPTRVDEWRDGKALFASMRIDDLTIIDLFQGERTGTNADHLSLVVAPDTDLYAVAASGEFEVDHEPFRIWGAQGYGLGLYVRDPDGNRVELKHYGPDRETP